MSSTFSLVNDNIKFVLVSLKVCWKNFPINLYQLQIKVSTATTITRTTSSWLSQSYNFQLFKHASMCEWETCVRFPTFIYTSMIAPSKSRFLCKTLLLKIKKFSKENENEKSKNKNENVKIGMRGLEKNTTITASDKKCIRLLEFRNSVRCTRQSNAWIDKILYHVTKSLTNCIV